MRETGLTRFQVAELGERPHLQMLQVKSVRFPAGQIPHDMFIDHAHTSELHQCTKQQWDLKEVALMLHSVYNDLRSGLRHCTHTKSIMRGVIKSLEVYIYKHMIPVFHRRLQRLGQRGQH